MNNENVFFNPGDAIASSHDFKEARRSAQIIKADKPTASTLPIKQETISMASHTKSQKNYKNFIASPRGEAICF